MSVIALVIIDGTKFREILEFWRSPDNMTSSSESFLRWDNHSQCLVPQGGSNSVPNRPDLSLAGQPQFETSTSTLANRHGRSQDRRIDGGRAVLRQQTVDYDKVLEAGYEFSKRFYFIFFGAEDRTFSSSRLATLTELMTTINPTRILFRAPIPIIVRLKRTAS